jgi:hypothetical protein
MINKKDNQKMDNLFGIFNHINHNLTPLKMAQLISQQKATHEIILLTIKSKTAFIKLLPIIIHFLSIKKCKKTRTF